MISQFVCALKCLKFSLPLQVTAGFTLDWKKHFCIGFCHKFWLTRLLLYCSALIKNHWSDHSWLLGEDRWGFISRAEEGTEQQFWAQWVCSQNTQSCLASRGTREDIKQNTWASGTYTGNKTASNLAVKCWEHQGSLKPLLATPWNTQKG